MTTATQFTSRPSDFQERQKALADLDRNAIVLASAGTGKTTLLIDRLSLLILKKEIPVERIVVLTFTKKAAEELRERLEARLRMELSKGENKLAKEALENIPRAQIGTIHSFAGHLLRLFPLQAQVDPGYREDEGEKGEQVFIDEWKKWSTNELQNNSPRKNLWKKVLEGIPLSDLKMLVSQISAPGIRVEGHLDKKQLQMAAKTWLGQLDRLIQNNPRSDRAVKFNQTVERIEKILTACTKETNKVTEKGFSLEGSTLICPKSWDGVSAAKLKSLHRLAKKVEQIDEKGLSQALQLLRPFVDILQKEIQRLGLVSFDGLLVFARNLVKNNKDVRAVIKKQYDAFLIDEFQDTDPYQGEILFYLAEDPQYAASHWSQVRLGPGRLFVVGDPKQSIYRFRGADMAAFDQFKNVMIQQGAEQVILSDNFRSHPHILESINVLFSPLMKEESGIQPPYAPLVPGLSNNQKGGMEVFLIADGESAPRAEAYRAFEGTLIADWITQHVGKKWNGRMFKYGDVAILFRSTNAFSPYLDALRSKGIPYLAEGEKYFYRTPEVIEFLNLLMAVAYPEDALSLVGVLRSPLGGLTDREIMDLKRHQSLSYLQSPKIHKDKVENLFEFLRSLNQRSDETPVGDLIRHIFDNSWFLELNGASASGEQAVANLHKLEKLAEKWSVDESLALKSFLNRFRKYRDEEKEEGENPLADVKFDAVKVMTIHKAKGLEFPVVMLPNMSASTLSEGIEKPVVIQDWRTQLTGIRLPSAKKVNGSMVILEEEIKKREAAEELRVFYVAATRAKEQLFFFLRSESRPTAPLINFITQSQGFPQEGQSAVTWEKVSIPVQNYSWVPPDLNFNSHQSKVRLDKVWDPRKVSEIIRRRKIEREEASEKMRFLSPTRLIQAADSADLEKGLPRDEDQQKGEPRAVQIGLLCHKVMEKWDFSIGEAQITKQLSILLRQAARLYELVPADPFSNKIIEEAEAILTRFYKGKTYEAMRHVRIRGREIPFLYPNSIEGESPSSPQIMRGVIDVLFERDGTWVVGDYKTNKIKKGSIENIKKKYKPQADAYKKAIKRTLKKQVSFELIFLRADKSIQL